MAADFAMLVTGADFGTSDWYCVHVQGIASIIGCDDSLSLPPNKGDSSPSFLCGKTSWRIGREGVGWERRRGRTNSLARIRMVATSNTLPAAKSMIDAAGSCCELACRDGALLSVRRGCSADTDVGGASDKDEVLG